MAQAFTFGGSHKPTPYQYRGRPFAKHHSATTSNGSQTVCPTCATRFGPVKTECPKCTMVGAR